MPEFEKDKTQVDFVIGTDFISDEEKEALDEIPKIEIKLPTRTIKDTKQLYDFIMDVLSQALKPLTG
jgi:hypothetical protein